MQRYRKLLILALLLAGIGAGALLLYRAVSIAPLAVRLLPQGDRLAYLNFKPVRVFWALEKSRPREMEDSYRDFVSQTGIQFERDLDEVAVSWQDSAGGRDVETAAVFSGRFDAAKLRVYLQKIASQEETYRGAAIFSIGNGGHTDHVCILDASRIAVTRGSSIDVMHAILDRTHQMPGGSWLLQTYYRKIPMTSLGWIISRIRSDSSAPQMGGLTLSFLDNTVTVLSLSYNGSLQVRADVFAASEADAKQIMDSANTFLTVYRTAGKSLGVARGDADLQAGIESIRVAQEGSVTTFTATCSERLLQKLQAEIKAEASPVSPGVEQHKR